MNGIINHCKRPTCGTAWLHQWVTSFPPVATTSRFLSNTQLAGEATAALINPKSSSTSAVNSESSWNKNDTLSAKVILTSLPTRGSHFIQQQWRAVRFVAGEAQSLSKSILRVYELNRIAYIHQSSGCLQIDYCFCFLFYIIILTHT